MVATFIQNGDVIDVKAPETVTAGRGVKVGDMVGIAQHAAENGADLALGVSGVYRVAKAGTQAWAMGEKVYFDDTANVFTTVSTSNAFAGWAAEVVGGGADDTLGNLRLSGGNSDAGA